MNSATLSDLSTWAWLPVTFTTTDVTNNHGGVLSRPVASGRSRERQAIRQWEAMLLFGAASVMLQHQATQTFPN